MSYLLLVDLRAIQGYIFSSNRLKDNVGASFLVSSFFKGIKAGSEDVSPEDVVIGGGNMFCRCKSREEAEQIIRDLSRKAIEKCPGLSFGAVYAERQEGETEQELVKQLWDKLQKEKQSRWQQTVLPSHGINAQCSSSIYAAEYVEIDADADEENKVKLISSVVKAKRDASEAANRQIAKEYQGILGNDFAFTDNFECLGTLKGEESYLAIVHIDGNDMGKKFAECSSFEAYKELSGQVDAVFGRAFSHLVQYTVDQINYGEWQHYQGRLKRVKEGENKKFFPIRPIFIGGDDVTFVCEARLGITLALEYVNKVKELSNGEYSCCAGVAIAKESYPFYQSQQMAQALCRSAKNKRKDKRSDAPYLDYQLLDSSTTDPLEMIRSQYHLPGGRVLYMKPYSADHMQAQMNNAKKLSDPELWPRSKVKEMRDALFGSEAGIQAYIKQIEARGDLKPPREGFEDDDSAIDSQENIYADMIELMDLIPTGGE